MLSKNAREDLLDALIDLTEAKDSSAPRAKLAEIAARIEAAQNDITLVPRNLILQSTICTCDKCQRTWVQEEGIYLLSTSRDGKTREERLLDYLTTGQQLMRVESRQGTPRHFPLCIRCVTSRNSSNV